jgi:hypothetical protein
MNKKLKFQSIDPEVSVKNKVKAISIKSKKRQESEDTMKVLNQ